MRLSRWQSFTPVLNQLQQFQDEMNRLFERWGGDGGQAGSMVYPATNVWEEGDQLFVEAELPGMDLKDLEIYVTGNNQLTLKGQRQPVAPDKGVRHRQERGFGDFSRTLTLPCAVNPDNVNAHLENGVLRLQLAKHESAKARKIQVTVDG